MPDPDAMPPPISLPPQHPGSTERPRFRPWWFFSFLLGPALLTLFFMVTLGESGWGPAMFVAILGSLGGGTFCGIHFALCQSSLSPGGRVGVGIVMAIGCVSAAFALCFAGCFAGGAIMGNL